MTIIMRQSIVKSILLHLAMTLLLFSITACGGGGGGGGGGGDITPPAKTTAVLKLNLTGTLPASTAIAGADVTLTLPANVTPALNGTVVSSGVVTPSGTFANGTQTPPVYTPATTSTPATLKVILANPVTAGVTQVGEVATITLQLTNGATPTTGSFGINAVSVIDAGVYGTINGMGAAVSNVTLQ